MSSTIIKFGSLQTYLKTISKLFFLANFSLTIFFLVTFLFNFSDLVYPIHSYVSSFIFLSSLTTLTFLFPLVSYGSLLHLITLFYYLTFVIVPISFLPLHGPLAIKLGAGFGILVSRSSKSDSSALSSIFNPLNFNSFDLILILFLILFFSSSIAQYIRFSKKRKSIDFNKLRTRISSLSFYHMFLLLLFQLLYNPISYFFILSGNQYFTDNINNYASLIALDQPWYLLVGLWIVINYQTLKDKIYYLKENNLNSKNARNYSIQYKQIVFLASFLVLVACLNFVLSGSKALILLLLNRLFIPLLIVSALLRVNYTFFIKD